MSEYRGFLKSRIPEYVLLVMTSAALFSTFMYGFHTTDAVRVNYALIMLWPALLLAVLTAVSFNPKSVVCGGLAVAAVFVAACVAGLVVTGGTLFSDSYDNAAFPLLIGFVVALTAYLSTRRYVSALAFAVIGCVACAFVQFMYLNGLVVQELVFALAASALCLCVRNRRAEVTSAQSKLSHTTVGLTGVALCAIPLIVACLVYFAAIAPLNPPARELKLFTEYYSLEEVQVSGGVNVEHRVDEELRSDSLNEETDKTNKLDDEQADTGDSASDKPVGSMLTNMGSGVANVVRYLLGWPYWLAAVVAVAVLVVLAIAGKLLWRRRRIACIAALPLREQARELQRYFDKRLKRFGIVRPAHLTPVEFATENGTILPIEAGAEGAYLAVTRAACVSTYGLGSPSVADCEAGLRLATVFNKNCRVAFGLARYARKFFFI